MNDQLSYILNSVFTCSLFISLLFVHNDTHHFLLKFNLNFFSEKNQMRPDSIFENLPVDSSIDVMLLFVNEGTALL